MTDTPVPGPQYPPPEPPANTTAPWTPAPPSTFRRGFGTGMGLALGAGAVLVALTLVSGLLSLAALWRFTSSDAAVTANRTTTTIWGESDATHTLHAIRVSGVIEAAGGALSLSASSYGYEIADQIDALDADQVDGLVLLMNTPGGSINGSRAIAQAVTRYQQRTGDKVLAFVQGMSASGGMYAMAGADQIVADQGTMVGSIGVILGPIAYYSDVTAITGSLLTSGVEAGRITEEYLTQGTGKDFGNPFREMTAEERAVYSQGLANEYQVFVDWVSQARGIPAETIRNDLGAHLYDVATAREKGLVDQIMGPQEAYRAAAELNGLDPADTRLVTTTTPGFLSVLLGAEARVYGHAEAGTAETLSSVLCQGTPVPLAFAGDPGRVCG